jgi:enoyl-CoA hydratase/carnithine racemase
LKIQDRVTIEKKDGVAEVRLARADKLNAMDMPMFSALAEAGLEAAADRSVRAIVLSGEGRAFSAGLDVQSVMSSIGQREKKPKRDEPQLFDGTDESPANAAQRAAWVWQEVPVPVIAAVHGVAYGAGIQVALGADIRFVSTW